MASVSSLGTGSGLDLSGILTKLMAVEQEPLTRLDEKEATYQAKLSAYGTMKGAFSSLQTAALALNKSSLYAGKTATSSDTSVLTTSANTAAKAGRYTIDVIDIAKSHSIASAGFSSITTDLSPSASGKLKIELGSLSGTTFTADTEKTAVTIDIDSASSSLEDIRDKINDANAGVRAAIVNVGSEGYKLTLTSLDTGAENSIRMTALASDGTTVLNDNTGLAQFSFDPAASAGSGKEFSVSTVAQDAHLKVDNLDIYRSSNTISDVLTGVTLGLQKTGTSTLTVAQDTASITSAVTAFVTAYNETNTQLRSLTSYDAETEESGLLFGDTTARALQTAMRDMVQHSFSGGASGLRTLSDIGVSMQRDGSLEFDSSKLTTALEKSPTAVSDLFTSNTTGKQGLAAYMESNLNNMLSTTGLFDSRTDGINRSIDDLSDQRDRLNIRLTAIEARYRAQFTALDTYVTSMQQTSDYLTEQLASMSSSSNS